MVSPIAEYDCLTCGKPFWDEIPSDHPDTCEYCLEPRPDRDPVKGSIRAEAERIREIHYPYALGGERIYRQPPRSMSPHVFRVEGHENIGEERESLLVRLLRLVGGKRSNPHG